MPRGTAWAGCCVQVVPKGSNINIPMFVMFKNEKCAALTDERATDRQCLPSYTADRQLLNQTEREPLCTVGGHSRLLSTPPHYAKLTLVDFPVMQR